MSWDAAAQRLYRALAVNLCSVEPLQKFYPSASHYLEGILDWIATPRRSESK